MDDDHGRAGSSKRDLSTAVSAASEQEPFKRAQVVPPETLPDSASPPTDPETGPVPRLPTFPLD